MVVMETSKDNNHLQISSNRSFIEFYEDEDDFVASDSSQNFFHLFKTPKMKDLSFEAHLVESTKLPIFTSSSNLFVKSFFVPNISLLSFEANEVLIDEKDEDENDVDDLDKLIEEEIS